MKRFLFIVVLFTTIAVSASLAAQTAVKPTASSPSSGLTEAQAFKKAQDSLIAYFRDVYMKTEECMDVLGDIAWEDISQKVIESLSLERDIKWEDAHYKGKAYFYSGEIYGFYAEVAVDKSTGGAEDFYLEDPGYGDFY
jgi:hypothetical protein